VREIAHAFGIDINKDIVRWVLAKHYRPEAGTDGPSWLSSYASSRGQEKNDGARTCRLGFPRARSRGSRRGSRRARIEQISCGRRRAGIGAPAAEGPFQIKALNVAFCGIKNLRSRDGGLYPAQPAEFFAPKPGHRRMTGKRRSHQREDWLWLFTRRKITWVKTMTRPSTGTTA
jgi:hypothetical protein